MIRLKYLLAIAVALLMALTPMLSVSALTGSTASLPFDFTGPIFPIAVSPPIQERPAIAYDNINNRYLVVWVQAFPGGLTDILVITQTFARNLRCGFSARERGRQHKAQGGARQRATLGTLAKSHQAREGGR